MGHSPGDPTHSRIWLAMFNCGHLATLGDGYDDGLQGNRSLSSGRSVLFGDQLPVHPI